MIRQLFGIRSLRQPNASYGFGLPRFISWFNTNTIRYRCARCLLLLLLFFCTALTAQEPSSPTPPPNLIFRHIIPVQTETLGMVDSIHQDAQGFMWFGGDNGLARYDGYNLKIYRHHENNPRSLSSNTVHHLLRTRSGQLWIATSAGLNRYNPTTDDFSRYNVASEAGDSNDIRDMLEDRQGRLWLASTSGFYHFNPEEQTTQAIRDPNLPEDTQIERMAWAIAEDQQGLLWIGYNARGVTRFDPDNNRFHHYRHNPEAAPDDDSGLTHNSARELFVDSHNRLWVGTLGGGLHRYDRASDRFVAVKHHIGEKSDAVLDINEDQQGLIWLGDGTSLHIFNPDDNDYSRFRFSEANPSGPGNHVVRSIYRDINNDMWIGYFPSGVDMIDKRASVFNNYGHNPHNENSVADGGILTGFEDHQGNLWIGAGFGLNYFERDTQTFTRFVHDPDDPTSISGSTVLSVLEDAQQTLWVGTWDRGLNRREKHSEVFIHYLPDAKKAGAIVGREAWDLLIDQEGTLWVITEEALNRYHPETDSFTSYLPKREQLNGDIKLYGRVLFEDSQQNLWVGGVHGLYIFDRAKNQFTKHYRQDEQDPTSLHHNFVWTVYEDSRQQLWIGTNGGGLHRLDRKTDKFIHYGITEGMVDQVVTGIEEDEQGYLWLSTLKGLSRFDPRDESFRHYDSNSGLSGNLFNRNTPTRLRSGELFFGNSKGFTIFRPQDLDVNPIQPPVVLTDFLVFNQPVAISEESPLHKSINTTNHITLKHNQSVFSLEFAALNFRSPELNQYAYLLEGFDNDWNYVGTRRSATYTNLSPGTYVFRVKASNNDDVWNEAGATVTLHILPPLWRTWWAYALYALLITGLIYWFIHTQQIKLAYERKKVEQERSLVKRLQALDKLRDDFLANTSHELRTPLHGIIGLAQSLLDGVTGKLPEATRQNLAMIVSSGKRLANLVNDILDFSKLKNQNVKLHPGMLDFHTLVETVLALSRPLISDKPLQLCNKVPRDLPGIYADEDLMIQIMHNLIGNAIKFTDQGEITVTADIEGEYVRVNVIDTGVGIPAEQLDSVFEAFHQVEDSERRTQAGTGLGLSITRKLIELHSGQVFVTSTPGAGSTFGFTVPWQTRTIEFADPVPAAETSDIREEPIAQPVNTEENLAVFHQQLAEDFIARILIVDDDAVNRKVLCNYLSLKQYQVLEASSGKDAIDLIQREQPIDLVLLDIMMPHLSGYDVCRRLREQYTAQDLPIIFLTARTQLQDLVTAFSLGANDFLHKPVAREELLARVHTHLQLLDTHRHLDKKVAERTAELDQKNQRLKHMQAHLQDVNRKLEEASLTDPLTGLRNRRFLNKFIGADTAIVARNYANAHADNNGASPIDSDLVFMLLDLDHFKQVNDQHGHNAGDQVLEQLSDVLRDVLRESDYLIRWGGEEFLLVMRFCLREQAVEMAERIRQTIANHAFAIESGATLKITCSIGFAPYPFYSNKPAALSWEQTIDIADRALYTAKQNGRNCWIGVESGVNGANSPLLNDEELLIAEQQEKIRLLRR